MRVSETSEKVTDNKTVMENNFPGEKKNQIKRKRPQDVCNHYKHLLINIKLFLN